MESVVESHVEGGRVAANRVVRADEPGVSYRKEAHVSFEVGSHVSGAKVRLPAGENKEGVLCGGLAGFDERLDLPTGQFTRAVGGGRRVKTMSARMTRAPSYIETKVRELINQAGARDVVAFCPRCKTMETLSLNGEGMAPTRRFTQRANAVYHACGSEIPCRLHSLT
jgi:hypothetical protein